MPVTISAQFQRHTDRAVLVDLSTDADIGLEIADSTPTWLPKSQILNAPDFDVIERGVTVELVLTDWIARQKNIPANTEVNLERFVARPPLIGGRPDINEGVAIVDESSGDVMCWCADSRTGNMIAAALNLTQGKV